MIRHRFIALEGADGSGKTTVRKHIFSRLRASGAEILTIPQHGWLVPAAAEVIVAAKYQRRELTKDELVEGYLLDKLATVEALIRPHLPFRHVLADRYIASDAVYNEVLWGVSYTETLDRYAQAAVLLPDLVVYLDTPPQVAFGRASQRRSRGGDAVHAWDTLHHQTRLYAGFRQVLERWPSPVVCIENAGPIEATLLAVDSQVIDRWLTP